MADRFTLSLAALCGAAIVLVSASAFAQPAPANEARIALVIGNSAYRYDRLKNPVNDAEDIAHALRSLGFHVTLRKDASYRQMLAAVNEFGRELKKSGVGLFYFAGHGVQSKGRNYLIPVNATVNTESDLEFEALDAYRVLAFMEEAGNRVNIVILDACRNNPYARAFRSATRGLAQMEAAKGSFVAFATAPGSIALDGTGRNGVYTHHLLTSLRHPDTDIDKVFRRVTAEVSRTSGGKQVPWISSSLTGDFYFRRGAQAAAAAPLTAPAIRTDPEVNDRLFWESVRNSQNPDELNAYLQQFPNGQFAPLARARLQSLTSTGRPSASAEQPAATSAAAQPDSKAPAATGEGSAVAKPEGETLTSILRRIFRPSDGQTQETEAAAAKPDERKARQELEGVRFIGLLEQSEDAEFALIRTLLPGDPGYFPKHPQWAEYVVKIKNIGGSPVRIEGVRLIDSRGVFVEAAKTYTQLTVELSVSEQQARNVGLGVASMFIPFVGFAALGMEADEQAQFAKDFEARSLKATTIDTDAEMHASVFLPLVRNPRAFVLDYEVSSQKKNLRLTLPQATK